MNIDNLPSTTAGLEQALVILQEATGGPDGEVERLLGEWDILNIRYTSACAPADKDSLALDPLPIRTGDQVYQAALL